MNLYVTHLIKHSVLQAFCISLQHTFSLIWKGGRSLNLKHSPFLCLSVSLSVYMYLSHLDMPGRFFFSFFFLNSQKLLPNQSIPFSILLPYNY